MRHLPYLCLLLLLTLLPSFLLGCSSSSNEVRDEETPDQVIGRPPAPEEDDPFFARALPADAVPVDAQGRISTAPREVEPTAEEPTESPETNSSEEPHEIAAASSELTDPSPSEATAEEAIPSPQNRRNACFSCVRICPLDANNNPRCGDNADDLICGWGTADDPLMARRHAQANCDATLDMARQMPTYSEISGGCPPASCQ